MYKSCNSSGQITLWCDGIKNGEPEPNKKKSDDDKVSSDEDDIFRQLKDKHSGMDNPKIRLWPKLIAKGRYDDYNTPPDIPLLSSTAKKKKKATNDASTCSSPMKNAQLCRICLEDLKTLNTENFIG